MAKGTLTAEEAAEYQRLIEKYTAVVNLGAEALRARDMERFRQTEEELAILVGRVKEILGTIGQRWSAS
jgi:hypothetical protein